MKPDIRLIALDMDGTLLSSDHFTVPARNQAALRAAAERGVAVAIASGRCWSLIHETAESLGCVRYGVTANGAHVLDAVTGETLLRTPMDRDRCGQIIDILRRRGLTFELYIDGKNYVERRDLDGLAQFSFGEGFIGMFLRNMTLVEDMKAVAAAESPEKFDIFYVPPEVRPLVVEELAATGPLAFTGALDGNLELTAPEATKGAALSALAARLGLTAEQVMAFGDADNDVEMLAWAGWSFAMENGTATAKKAARHQTGSNDAAGVAMAVERYVLEK